NPSPSAKRRSLGRFRLSLLEEPRVPIGVAEVGERVVVAVVGVRARLPSAGSPVPDVADLHPTSDELGPTASMSVTTRCVPRYEPGAASVSPVPMVIEQAEPGGVNWTTRNSSLARW